MESKLLLVVILTVGCVICGILADDETMATEMTAAMKSETSNTASSANAEMMSKMQPPPTTMEMDGTKPAEEQPQGDEPKPDEDAPTPLFNFPKNPDDGAATEASVFMFTIPKLDDLPPPPPEPATSKPTPAAKVETTTKPAPKKQQQAVDEPKKSSASAVEIKLIVTIMTVTLAVLYF
jgi:hypothetical protein